MYENNSFLSNIERLNWKRWANKNKCKKKLMDLKELKKACADPSISAKRIRVMKQLADIPEFNDLWDVAEMTVVKLNNKLFVEDEI